MIETQARDGGRESVWQIEEFIKEKCETDNPYYTTRHSYFYDRFLSWSYNKDIETRGLTSTVVREALKELGFEHFNNNKLLWQGIRVDGHKGIAVIRAPKATQEDFLEFYRDWPGRLNKVIHPADVWIAFDSWCWNIRKYTVMPPRESKVAYWAKEYRDKELPDAKAKTVGAFLEEKCLIDPENSIARR